MAERHTIWSTLEQCPVLTNAGLHELELHAFWCWRGHIYDGWCHRCGWHGQFFKSEVDAYLVQGELRRAAARRRRSARSTDGPVT